MQVAAADLPTRQRALSELCQIYWDPAFTFVCRRVGDKELARDLVQAFFTKVIEKDYFASADSNKGRFRTFLLTMLNRHLSKSYAKELAQKRGGDVLTVSRDSLEQGQQQPLEPIEEETAETLFEKKWAMTLLSGALAQLRGEQGSGAKNQQFELLIGYLDGSRDGQSYREVAQELGVSEGAVKTAVCRLRKRYGEILRERVADLVVDPAEIDDEIRYLLSVV